MINTAYVVLLLSAFYLFMKYAFGVLSPFIFAFVLAAVLQRPVNAIVKKTPLKKGLTSVLFVLLTVAAVLTVIALAGATVVSEARGFVDRFMTYVGKLPEFVKSIEATLLGVVDKLPGGIGSTLHTTIENFVDKLFLPAQEHGEMVQAQQGTGIDIFSMLKTPLSGVWATAKQIPNVLVGCLIFVIASCFITSDYDRITGFVKRQLSPEKRRNATKTKKIVFSSVGKLVKSYALIMLITFVEMCIGLTVLKIIGVYGGNYLFIIATITAIVDIFPVLGTGTVLIPWGVFMLITGRFGMGIGLLVLYVCITVIRQVLEPKVVA
ncbi:MAG: AI-2E family transporter, partial [Oscillospiraceae bacterium]|nr:AI-2E family transporter [Oscillospiraceae bacterium]